MRKNVMSCAAAGRSSSAAPKPPSSAPLRLTCIVASLQRTIRPRPTARRNDDWSIHANSFAHGRANLGVDHQAGVLVLVGGVAIEYDQLGALSLGAAREPRRW